MGQTMTASTESKMITDGQIDNVVNKLRDALRKHRAEFELASVQQVLGVDNLGMELLTPFRKRVEAISSLIVRRVKVNRSLTPQEALDATDRKQYTDRKVVATMPQGEGDEVDMYFFKPSPEAYQNGVISDDRLAKEFDLRNLKPDPLAQAAVNAADPTFADDRPNGTHWKNQEGKWCFAAFNRWFGDERSVRVDRRGSDWSDYWWFAGLRK